MKKYTIAQVGCGARGKVHIDSWIKNSDRCTLVAVCDLDEARMRASIQHYADPLACYADAEEMLSEVMPDIFCFSTPPNIRLSMVELAVKYKVKGLVFEKPMALSLDVANKIMRLCREHNIKTAVSHQHKYLTSFEKFASVLDTNDIGTVYQITATCQNGLSLLGTHYIEYMLWANRGVKAKWVAAHVNGKASWLNDREHPSPDYVLAKLEFENGVYGTLEFGKCAPMYMGRRGSCIDNRLTAYGTHGYIWCDTDGGWGMFTKDTGREMLTGKGDDWSTQERTRLQPLFVRDFIDWMDDGKKVHPSNLDITYHGYEIVEGICMSALDHVRIDLPLTVHDGNDPDVFQRMRDELPECAPLYP
ncbi:MAG: Gfo/Idh/MocA family protein [Anaerolineae bacterium]